MTCGSQHISEVKPSKEQKLIHLLYLLQCKKLAKRMVLEERFPIELERPTQGFPKTVLLVPVN